MFQAEKVTGMDPATCSALPSRRPDTVKVTWREASLASAGRLLREPAGYVIVPRRHPASGPEAKVLRVSYRSASD
jgi:hypothetical protein